MPVMTDRDATRRDLVFALPQIIKLLWRVIVSDVFGQMYFSLSPVDAPQRKVWAVNYLERNRLNFTSGRHLRRPPGFPVPEVANIALHHLTAGVGAPTSSRGRRWAKPGHSCP